MAEDIVKRLLLKIGLDASEADTFLKNLKRQLDDLEDTEQRRAQTRKKTQQEDAAANAVQLEAAKKQVAQAQVQATVMKEEIELKQISLKAMTEEFAADKARLDIKMAQIRVMASEGTINSEVLKQLQTEIALEKQKLALQQSQLRAATIGMPGPNAKVKEPSAEKWTMQGISRGLFGGGLLGSIAGGTLLGAGTIEVVEQITEKVKELGARLMEASGAEVQLQQEFIFLATNKGADPTEMIEKLRTATRGLVEDTDLFKVANGFMRANTGLTNESMVELIKNTTNLARATGGQGGVERAMQALARTFQTGRPMILAQVAGLTNLQAILRQIPAGVSPATRQLMEFQLISEALAKAVTKIQIPVTTLPELFTQVSMASKNFIGDIAAGILGSNGFGTSIESMSKSLMKMQPELEKLAKTIGKDLGDALKFVVDNWGILKFAMESVLAIKTLDWSLSIIKSFGDMAFAIRKATIEMGLFGAAETAAGAGGKENLVERISKPLPGIGWGVGKAIGVGKEAVGAAGAVGGTAVTGAGAAAEVGTSVAAGSVTAPLAIGGAAVLGVAYAAMKENDLTLKQSLEGIKQYDAELTDLVAEIKSGVVDAFKEFIKQAQEVNGVVQTMATVLASIPSQLPEWTKGFIDAAKELDAFGNKADEVNKKMLHNAARVALPPLAMAEQGFADLKEESERRETIQKMTTFAPPKVSNEAILAGAHTHVDYKLQPPPDDDESINEKRKIAQLQLQIREAELKSEFELKKQYLSMEEEANKSSYEVGLESFAEYQAKQRLLNTETYNQQVKEIQQTAALKKKQIADDALIGRGKVPLTESEQTEVKLKQKVVDVQSKEQIQALGGQLALKDAAQVQQALEMQQAAYKTYTAEVTKLLQEGYAEQEKLLQENFKNGIIGADQYLAERKSLIIQERDAELAALADEKSHSKDNAAVISQLTVKEIQVRVDAEKQLTELTVSQEQVRLDAVKNIYEQRLKILETQQKASQFGVKTGNIGARQSQAEDLRQLIQLNDQYIAQLKVQAELDQNNPKAWAEVVSEIEKAKFAQQEYNEKLREMQNFGEPLARIFNTIAESFNRSNSGFANFLRQMSESVNKFAEVQKMLNTGNGAGGPFGLKGLWSNTFGHKDQVKSTLPDIPKQSPEQQAAAQFALDLKASGDKTKGFADTASAAAKKLQNDWQNQVAGFTTKLGAVLTSFANVVKQAEDKISKGAKSGGQQGGGGDDGEDGGDGGDGGDAGDSGNDSAESDISMDVGSSINKSIADQVAADGISNAEKSASSFGATLDKATKSGDDWSSKLGEFTQGLQKAFAAVGEFMQSLQVIGQAKTAKGGAASGAMSMGMTGLNIGMQFGPMGAAIGVAAGAVLGGITGGIIGAKTQAAQQAADKINAQLKSITTQMNEGTISLGDGIKQLEAERQTAIQTLGGSKKGQKQLGPILEALNAQLAQLVQQQKEVLQQLNQQLAILSAPQGYQGILDTLDQIIQKYQAFASAAAGNTNAVTQANEFLVKSLQNYATTLGDQVNQAEQSAISDALQLIQLQQEATDMQQNLAKANFGILTQGVMARQQSGAQTKGAQIEANDEQYNLQKTQLDNEMALTKFKVDAQSKIFGMAQDQAGLEAQMLQLQESAAAEQYKQVAAEVAALAELTQALANGGKGLPPGIFNAVGGIDMQALLQLLGLGAGGSGGGTGGGGNQLNNVPSTYTEYFSALQNTAYSGIEEQLVAAAATPFGSSQRKQVESEFETPGLLKLLQDAGLVSAKPDTDPNWINFANWIMNQATSTPSYDVGGIVPQDQIAKVHQGEYIMPNNIVSAFIGSMQAFSDAISKFLGQSDAGGADSAPIDRQGPSAIDKPSSGGVLSQIGQTISASIQTSMTSVVDELTAALGKMTGTTTTVPATTAQTKAPVNQILGQPQVTQQTATLPTIPDDLKANNLVGGFVSGIKKFTDSLANFGSKSISNFMTNTSSVSGDSNVNSSEVNNNSFTMTMHQQIFDLATQRVKMESTLITAQQQQTLLDMQRLTMLDTILDKVNAAGGSNGGDTLEENIMRLYQQRGRYGSSGFRRSQL